MLLSFYLSFEVTSETDSVPSQDFALNVPGANLRKKYAFSRNI